MLWNQTNVDRLRKDLLKNYDVNARPEHYATATHCNLALTIINLDLDEGKSVLKTHAWLKMNWTDSKIKWDNYSYGGITELHVQSDEAKQITILF